MSRKSTTFILAFFSTLSFAFAGNSPGNEGDTTAKVPHRPKIVFGGGPGMLTFYGDVGYKKLNDPIKFKPGYSFDIQYNVTGNFGTDLYFLAGQVFGNERTLTRNLNFESSIMNVGLMLRYDFNRKIKHQILSPFIGVGFEMLNFNTKTDIKDANGVEYNYWSDGTIRNIAENPDSGGTMLYRDYVYETDVRDQNLDGFGKYSTSSFAVPIQIGFRFNLSPKLYLRLTETYHYTFTDYIDNITAQGVGVRKGNSNPDNYLHSAITLHFDVGAFTKKEKSRYDKIDFQHLVAEDSDGDGVPDMADNCEGTEKGVKVDAHGCPPDADGDGVPDYLDKEPNSRKGARVDELGVALPADYGTDTLGLAAEREKQMEIDANGLPEDFRFADTNNNGHIEQAEITKAIDMFFEGNLNFSVQRIYKLIDYFFDQK